MPNQVARLSGLILFLLPIGSCSSSTPPPSLQCGVGSKGDFCDCSVHPTAISDLTPTATCESPLGGFEAICCKPDGDIPPCECTAVTCRMVTNYGCLCDVNGRIEEAVPSCAGAHCCHHPQGQTTEACYCRDTECEPGDAPIDHCGAAVLNCWFPGDKRVAACKSGG